MLGILDGTVLPADQVQIPATDEGLLRGDGVFEVMRLYDGRPFARRRPPRAHGALGARTCCCRSTSTAVRADIDALLEAARPTGDGVLRVLVTRGGRRIGFIEPFPSLPDTLALKTITYAPTRILDGVKSLSLRGEHARDPARAEAEGADEALLVTPHGRVLEAPTSSFFCSFDGRTLVTPPLDDHVLDSITRAAPADGRATSPSGRSRVDELAGVQEAFLASTVREVLPVHAIDGRELPVGGAADARRGRADARADRAGARRAALRAAAWARCASSRSSGTGRSSSRPPRSRARCATSTRSCSSTPASTTTTSSARSSSRSSASRGPERELGIHGGTNTEQTARMLAALGPLLADGAAGRRARLRRHELDARRRARRGAGAHPGRARRGRDAVVRPRDARGAQPRPHRPPLRPAAVPVADGGREPRSASASPGASSSSAT